MRTEKTFHQEFAAALQFPAYYGENMAAFDECLCDVSWLGGGGLLIVVRAPASCWPTTMHMPKSSGMCSWMPARRFATGGGTRG